jgi:hypothetical protein
MAGIVEEGNALLQEDFENAVLDAGIIAGAQRGEHYEIAAYGSSVKKPTHHRARLLNASAARGTSDDASWRVGRGTGWW